MSNSASMPIYSCPADAALDIRPITPEIGAEVHGVRLSGDLPGETMTAIRDALLRHRVVFFRGQNHLDDAGHQAFARLLGPLVAHPNVPAIAGTEAVLELDSENARARRWHTDTTYAETFPLGNSCRTISK
jgi:alpha-ketoglutarate-dependent sulfate ester dioxygenase